MLVRLFLVLTEVLGRVGRFGYDSGGFGGGMGGILLEYCGIGLGFDGLFQRGSGIQCFGVVGSFTRLMRAMNERDAGFRAGAGRGYPYECNC